MRIYQGNCRRPPWSGTPDLPASGPCFTQLHDNAASMARAGGGRTESPREITHGIMACGACVLPCVSRRVITSVPFHSVGSRKLKAQSCSIRPRSSPRFATENGTRQPKKLRKRNAQAKAASKGQKGQRRGPQIH